MHRSGFVNIVGQPNVGKSTIMNQLVGEKMSIITYKAQTTRHRIMGIVNGEDYQIVYSDTPGYVMQTANKLHENMNQAVTSSFEDADLVLYMVDPGFDKDRDMSLAKLIKPLSIPVIAVINKIDKRGPVAIQKMNNWLNQEVPNAQRIEVSALNGDGIPELMEAITSTLPEGPAYFPKDSLTDRPVRFFVTEIIREKIFLNYKQEIPYATEVSIEAFQDEEDITRIRAIIYVGRATQKSIIIGKGGKAIKEVGIQSRKDIEDFLQKKVYLELFVKIKDDWLNNENTLKKFGYTN